MEPGKRRNGAAARSASATASREHSARELALTERRTVRRAATFTILPGLIIALLAVNAVWEVVRVNATKAQFSILDVSTTVTLLSVAVGFLLARLQWARAMRPALGLAIDPDENATRELTAKWTMRLVNAGPGVPVVDLYDYYVSFDNASYVPGDKDFIGFSELSDIFAGMGWVSEVDYWLKYITAGGTLPIADRYSDGGSICWFTPQVLRTFKRFDIRVRVVDLAGDTHERVFPCAFFMEAVLPPGPKATADLMPALAG